MQWGGAVRCGSGNGILEEAECDFRRYFDGGKGMDSESDRRDQDRGGRKVEDSDAGINSPRYSSTETGDVQV